MSTKKDQALEHIKEAEKYLKTGLLKWKPDLDSAADEYNKAATCYKTVSEHAQCRECLSKAANCYQQHGSLFAAAKCYDQGALMSKELGELPTVISLTDRAAKLYQQHGSPDSAAQALERGAKIVEAQRPADALPMYQRAADVVMLEDRPRQAAGLVSKASRLLIRLSRFDEAVQSVRREMGYQQEVEDTGQLNRLTVVLVLVHLAREDVVAARKAFNEWNSYCEHQEMDTLTALLEGSEEGDSEQVAAALAAPFIRHMDVDYAKLAASLRAPHLTLAKQKASTTAGTSASSDKQATDGNENEAAGGYDFGGALC